MTTMSQSRLLINYVIKILIRYETNKHAFNWGPMIISWGRAQKNIQIYLPNQQ